jgi:hypothetical protein
MRAWFRLAAVAVAALLCVEVGVRASGLTDFPIYNLAPDVGYYLAADQNGRFMRRNAWFVDADGFNNEAPFKPSPDGCLLIGDSVAYGGNPVDYHGRVGALAAAQANRPIWVAATGGWNLRNQLGWLQMHKRQVSQISRIIMVLNDGDFGPAGPWTGDLSFPTKRPRFATLYLIRRYLLPHPSDLPAIDRSGSGADRKAWVGGLDRLLAWYPGSIKIILYADKADLTDHAHWRTDTAPIQAYATAHAQRISISDASANWVPSLYADNIHPNAEGRRLLAHKVADACAA